MPSTRLRVAICGGGVGGLTLAAALSKSPDIEVDVYEAARELTEVGAGVGMWPRTWKVLHALGLTDDLSHHAIIAPQDMPKVTFHFRKGDEPSGGVTFQKLITPGGLITFHRPDFQRVLLGRLSPRTVRTHTSKRLVAFRQPSDPNGEVQLRFADGTTATCDLLVGADGVRSAVRAGMLGDVADGLRARGQTREADAAARAAAPRWSGTMAYRAVIRAEDLQRRFPNHRVLTQPHVYLGKDSEMTVYPIARGTLVNFAAFTARYDLEDSTLDPGQPWVQEVPRQTFESDFAAWEPEVQALIDCVKTTSRWAVHTTVPLRSFVHGRVVLLGDAAHAMMPYQGSGAGQAIEDAYILAALLSHPSVTHPDDLQRVAQVYDTVRRPVAQHVARVSREAGLLYTLNYPGLELPARGRSTHPRANSQNGFNGHSGHNGQNGHGGSNGHGVGGEAETLQQIYARIRANWEWAWETTADGDLQRALEMLASSAST